MSVAMENSVDSDNVSGSICIGGIVSRIAQYFGIALDHFDSTPYSFLDEKFIRNSNQFKKVNTLFVWKNEEAIEEEHDQDMKDIDLIGNVGLENVALEEEQVQTPPPPPPSSPRKRARASSSQCLEDEPEWVGVFFDRLSIIVTNIPKLLLHYLEDN